MFYFILLQSPGKLVANTLCLALFISIYWNILNFPTSSSKKTYGNWFSFSFLLIWFSNGIVTNFLSLFLLWGKTKNGYTLWWGFLWKNLLGIYSDGFVNTNSEIADRNMPLENSIDHFRLKSAWGNTYFLRWLYNI